MQLARVKIENYKSIENSDEFGVDKVTCLIGKNEAGKTAILEALYKLNPVESDKQTFDEEEFPRRHLATYRERKQREPAKILSTKWMLEDDDVSVVEKALGQGALGTREVSISKGYDNELKWEISIDEPNVVRFLLEGSGLAGDEIGVFAEASSILELLSKTNSIEKPTAKQSEFTTRVANAFPKGDPSKIVSDLLGGRLPKFVYFANYHQLPGKVSLNDLKQRKGNNTLRFDEKIFLSLLEMTKTSLEDIEGITQLEKLVIELESVEASLTDEIKNYWSQNSHLEVRVRYDQAKPSDPPPFHQGFIFNTRIFNTRHRATVSFEQRSHGFIWFFSFLVWFSQVKRSYGENLIILLDEPGLPLHGRAQQDLIRYINEKLRPHYQVVYTGHSPFIIDLEHIFSLRTVEDKTLTKEIDGRTKEIILGTKVSNKILSRDDDTLFPLQGIVGFDIAQTLFVGPYVVVTEGPAEKVYFEWFSRQLSNMGREGLDLRWAVCPAEGAAKITSFVTLFAGRNLKIAVVADYHEGQKKMIDSLEYSGLLLAGHLFRTSKYAGQGESDIEDLVGRELFIELVNNRLRIADPLKIPAAKPAQAPERVLKEVEAHCRTLPPGYEDFNHYMPAEYLLEIPPDKIKDLPGLKGALDRFEALFHDLNLLVSKP